MTPPFQPGDRVTVRHNKPLGVLVVQNCMRATDEKYDTGEIKEVWYIECLGNGCKFAGPATSLIKVEDNGPE